MTSSLSYHRSTCYDRHRMKGHTLDWANQPTLYKSYPDNPAIQLPELRRMPDKNLWHLDTPPPSVHPDINLLSTILDLTYLHTAKARHSGGDFFYRSAASAGALYPMEIYVGAYDIDGIDPGIYHYNMKNRQLIQVRDKNLKHEVADVFPPVSGFDVSGSFYITGIFFRSAWKYRKRAYRYVLLDAGHLLQNLVFALNTSGLPFSIQDDFIDVGINRILGIDDSREVCLSGVHLIKSAGAITRSSNAGSYDLPPPSLTMACQTAMKEISYKEIKDIHQSGKMTSFRTHRIRNLQQDIGVSPESWLDIESSKPVEGEAGYPRAVFIRRSKRNFVNRQLSRNTFIRLLELLNLSLLNHNREMDICPSSVVTGFLANHIEGITPGFYLYDTEHHRMKLVEKGNFGQAMAHICLEQSWLGNAAVHFLFMGNFKQIDGAWGPRGYRYSLLTAGRMGQLIYVGAAALSLGCCGIGAIFDYEAQNLLGLSSDAFLTYLVAAGPVKS